MFSAILIAGPTASGKSALAIALARALGGAVVNADSMQVYRDLRIITARPTPEEEASVPHAMFGHVEAAVNYSAGHWIADMRETLARLKGEGLLPVIAGGTGLYFKALVEGLSDIPAVPDAIREAVRASAEGRPTPELHDELAACDTAMAARLEPNDRQRILRALEVFRATGVSLSAFQSRRGGALLDAASCQCIFLAPDRKALYARIDARFEAMMREGALDEVRGLGARGLDPALPAMRAHGVPGLLAYLAGGMSLADAISKGQIDTRHYSKRQFTWFRHQLPMFEWAAPEQAEAHILQAVDGLRARGSTPH